MLAADEMVDVCDWAGVFTGDLNPRTKDLNIEELNRVWSEFEAHGEDLTILEKLIRLIRRETATLRMYLGAVNFYDDSVVDPYFVPDWMKRLSNVPKEPSDGVSTTTVGSVIDNDVVPQVAIEDLTSPRGSRKITAAIGELLAAETIVSMCLDAGVPWAHGSERAKEVSEARTTMLQGVRRAWMSFRASDGGEKASRVIVEALRESNSSMRTLLANVAVFEIERP